MNDSDAVLLIARLCLAGVFLFSGVHKAIYFAEAQQEFRAARLPFPDLCLVLVIGLHLIGSLGLITGVYAELCAAVLAAFMLVVTYWVRDFWNKSGTERLATARDATANLAIFGGLLFAAVVGPGNYVLD